MCEVIGILVTVVGPALSEPCLDELLLVEDLGGSLGLHKLSRWDGVVLDVVMVLCVTAVGLAGILVLIWVSVKASHRRGV